MPGYGLFLVGALTGSRGVQRLVLPEKLSSVLEKLLDPQSTALPAFPLIDTTSCLSVRTSPFRARFPDFGDSVLIPVVQATDQAREESFSTPARMGPAHYAASNIKTHPRTPSSPCARTTSHQLSDDTISAELDRFQLDNDRVSSSKIDSDASKAQQASHVSAASRPQLQLLYAGPDTWPRATEKQGLN